MKKKKKKEKKHQLEVDDDIGAVVSLGLKIVEMMIILVIATAPLAPQNANYLLFSLLFIVEKIMRGVK